MINLKLFREYWETLSQRMEERFSVLPVTIDKEMGRKIQALPAGRPHLFIFPPMATGGNYAGRDGYYEDVRVVLFLMRKYNPQKETAFEVLEDIQELTGHIKNVLLGDHAAPFSIDAHTIETAPETELYGTFAGWSIAFNSRSCMT